MGVSSRVYGAASIGLEKHMLGQIWGTTCLLGFPYGKKRKETALG